MQVNSRLVKDKGKERPRDMRYLQVSVIQSFLVNHFIAKTAEKISQLRSILDRVLDRIWSTRSTE